MVKRFLILFSLFVASLVNAIPSRYLMASGLKHIARKSQLFLTREKIKTHYDQFVKDKEDVLIKTMNVDKEFFEEECKKLKYDPTLLLPGKIPNDSLTLFEKTKRIMCKMLGLKPPTDFLASVEIARDVFKRLGINEEVKFCRVKKSDYDAVVIGMIKPDYNFNQYAFIKPVRSHYLYVSPLILFKVAMGHEACHYKNLDVVRSIMINSLATDNNLRLLEDKDFDELVEKGDYSRQQLLDMRARLKELNKAQELRADVYGLLHLDDLVNPIKDNLPENTQRGSTGLYVPYKELHFIYEKLLNKMRAAKAKDACIPQENLRKHNDAERLMHQSFGY